MYRTRPEIEKKITGVIDSLKIMNQKLGRGDLPDNPEIGTIHYKLANNTPKQIAHKTFKMAKRFYYKKKYHYQICEIEKIPVAVQPNYFSNERIAVYTCIIGKYDRVYEPVFHPDNCDYYIVTDCDIPVDSKWVKIDIQSYHDLLNGLSNAEKNRYFKMHPNVLFPQYNYSVYVDGNIEIVGDMTEFINKIGEKGVGIFLHPYSHCIYREGIACICNGRATEQTVKQQLSRLKSLGMPENYGMLECCVIARKHHDDLCKKLMDGWWHDFLMNPSRRDQLSLTYILYKNGVKVEDIAFPEGSLKDNYALRRYWH